MSTPGRDVASCHGVIKNNQARPMRRAVHWYNVKGQVHAMKVLHHARQAVKPGQTLGRAIRYPPGLLAKSQFPPCSRPLPLTMAHRRASGAGNTPDRGDARGLSRDHYDNQRLADGCEREVVIGHGQGIWVPSGSDRRQRERLFVISFGLEVVAIVLFMHAGAIRFWNYALYCGAIAAGVLTLLDLPQPSDYAAEGYRVLWTLCGVGIAVLVIFLAGLLARRTAKAPPQPATQPA
jgi:hypothetical protein